MVVLIGEGHVAYGLGAERQARLTFAGRIASVIPVRIEDPETEAPVAEARASYADFLWGVPREAAPLYPVLGLSAPERDPGQPMTVIQVEKESVGAAAGFAVGDVLVAMDGTPLDQKETYNRLMSEKRWGDSARFEVLPRRRGEDAHGLLPPDARPAARAAGPSAAAPRRRPRRRSRRCRPQGSRAARGSDTAVGDAL